MAPDIGRSPNRYYGESGDGAYTEAAGDKLKVNLENCLSNELFS